MRILVIGGTGFVGPAVVRRALEHGHQVAVFHRGQNHTPFDPDVPHIHGDTLTISERRSEIEAFGPQVVIDTSQFRADTTKSVISLVKDLAERYVLVSSKNVYRGYGVIHGTEPGPIQPMPVRETDELRTKTSRYLTETEDKLFVERAALEQDELPTTVIRAPGIFGPGDPIGRVGGPMRKMEESGGIVRMSSRKAGFRWGMGFLYDIADSFILCSSDPRPGNHVYNVGYREAWSTLEWYRLIADVIKWAGDIYVAPDAPDESDINYEQDFYGDTSLIRDELGYAESFTVEEALEISVQSKRSGSTAYD